MRKLDFKKLWYSAIGGFLFGFLVALFTSIFTAKDINGFLMLIFILGGAVGSYFILLNNKFFDNV